MSNFPDQRLHPTVSFSVAELAVWAMAVFATPAAGLLSMAGHRGDGAVISVRVAKPFEQSAGIASPSRIDLNRASAEELELLPGIGPSKARKIVEYRTEHGSFRSIEELAAIRGISKSMLERLSPLLSLSGL